MGNFGQTLSHNRGVKEMSELGTRAVMHRLHLRTHHLAVVAAIIAEFGDLRDKYAKGSPEYAELIYHPDLLELTGPLFEHGGNYDIKEELLNTIADSNSVNELSPELFRLVEWLLPWFVHVEPECKGAKCLRIGKRAR